MNVSSMRDVFVSSSMSVANQSLYASSRPACSETRTCLSMRATDSIKYDSIQREYWTSLSCSFFDSFAFSSALSSASSRRRQPSADSACRAASASAARRRACASARPCSAPASLPSRPSYAAISFSAAASPSPAPRASSSAAPASARRASMSRRTSPARSRSSARRASASACAARASRSLRRYPTGSSSAHSNLSCDRSVAYRPRRPSDSASVPSSSADFESRSASRRSRVRRASAAACSASAAARRPASSSAVRDLSCPSSASRRFCSASSRDASAPHRPSTASLSPLILARCALVSSVSHVWHFEPSRAILSSSLAAWAISVFARMSDFDTSADSRISSSVRPRASDSSASIRALVSAGPAAAAASAASAGGPPSASDSAASASASWPRRTAARASAASIPERTARSASISDAMSPSARSVGRAGASNRPIFSSSAASSDSAAAACPRRDAALFFASAACRSRPAARSRSTSRSAALARRAPRSTAIFFSSVAAAARPFRAPASISSAAAISPFASAMRSSASAMPAKRPSRRAASMSMWSFTAFALSRAVSYDSMSKALRTVASLSFASDRTRLISPCGVYTAYLNIRLAARGPFGSLNPSMPSTRSLSSDGARFSTVVPHTKYDSFLSWPIRPAALLSWRFISYRVPSTSKRSRALPEGWPCERSASGLCEPSPNRANSMAISMDDLPDPTSPSNSVMPPENSMRASLWLRMLTSSRSFRIISRAPVPPARPPRGEAPRRGRALRARRAECAASTRRPSRRRAFR